MLLAGGVDGALGARELLDRADQDADLLRADAVGDALRDPGGNGLDLGLGRREGADEGRGPSKTDWTPVRSSSAPSSSSRRDGRSRSDAAADLAGGAVVHLERAGAAADLDAFGGPGEGRAEDALADVAGEEEAVVLAGAGGLQEAELGEAEVLGLVDDDVVEGRAALGREGGGGVVEGLGVGLEAAGGEGGAGAGEDGPEGVAAVAGQAGAAAVAGEVAVGGGVADVAGVDDQAPFVAEEGGVDGGAFGRGGEGGADVGGGGDADRAEQALVLGEGGGAEVADGDVRRRGEEGELGRRPSARRSL